MTVTYTRDLEHNYMRITGEDLQPDTYALKMCRTHTIPYLVPAEVREIDAQICLYYVTDTLMSLTNRCLARRLSGAEVRDLLTALRSAEEALIEYLLDIGTLYLTPETVFLDGQGTWRFTALPYAQTEGDLASFLSALCGLTDPDDADAVCLCQTLCACISHGACRLRDLMRLIDADLSAADAAGMSAVAQKAACAADQMPRAGMRDRTVRDRMPPAGRSKRPHGGRPDHPAEIRRRAASGTDDGEKAHATEPVPEDGQAVRPGIITILFAAVLLADVYVRKEYVLTSAGNLLSVAILLLSLIGAVGSCFMGGEEEPRDKGRKRKHMKPKKHARQSAPRTRRHEREEVPLYLTQMAAMQRQEEPDDEEAYTTLLGAGAKKRTAKLYGRDGDRHRHIDLSHLPLTLGRDRTDAGVVLSEPSVSRLHAHILRDEDDRIIVRDLNSANGTFLNGVRLSPNESAPLTIGDEVCFGGAVFDYV